LKKIVKTSKRW